MDDSIVGYLVVTVHKAENLEKKGFVGKSDPYLLLKVIFYAHLD